MESWTMTSLPLSGAKGLSLSAAKEHDDGAQPGRRVPTGQWGVRNGKSEVELAPKLAYVTSRRLRREPRKA